MMPIMLGLIGYVASIIGVFSMFVLKNGKDAAAALRNTTFIAALCSGQAAIVAHPRLA